MKLRCGLSGEKIEIKWREGERWQGSKEVKIEVKYTVQHLSVHLSLKSLGKIYTMYITQYE